MRRGVTAVVAIGLLLSACSSTPEVPGPGPDIGGPTSSPSPSETDEWAVPEVITEDYARRVLTEIERERAEFMRWILTSELGEEPPAEIAMWIHRTYHADVSDEFVAELVRTYETGESRERLASEYGQYLPAVLEVLVDRPQCPLLRVSWDATTTEASSEGRVREPSFIAIDPQIDGQPVNLTGWVYRIILGLDSVSDKDVEEAIAERQSCQ